ncbi:MAG: hypothetical protein ACUVSA_10910 [Desulfosoma sp.]|uniref:hypothetical protein n=1 Tax=Desulfosoma sp. TaxID=2603217 RepID=UPI0040495BE0
MKIENGNPIGSILWDAEKRGKSGTGAASFDELLHQEMESGLQGVAVSAAGTLKGNDVGRMEGSAGMPGAWLPAMQAMGGALDRLAAACSHALGGSLDLQAMGRTLSDLGHAAEEVLQHTQMFQDDHPVRRMAQEARLLAYVESIKWRRGDYV